MALRVKCWRDECRTPLYVVDGVVNLLGCGHMLHRNCIRIIVNAAGGNFDQNRLAGYCPGCTHPILVIRPHHWNEYLEPDGRDEEDDDSSDEDDGDTGDSGVSGDSGDSGDDSGPDAPEVNTGNADVGSGASVQPDVAEGSGTEKMECAATNQPAEKGNPVASGGPGIEPMECTATNLPAETENSGASGGTGIEPMECTATNLPAETENPGVSGGTGIEPREYAAPAWRHLLQLGTSVVAGYSGGIAMKTATTPSQLSVAKNHADSTTTPCIKIQNSSDSELSGDDTVKEKVKSKKIKNEKVKSKKIKQKANKHAIGAVHGGHGKEGLTMPVKIFPKAGCKSEVDLVIISDSDSDSDDMFIPVCSSSRTYKKQNRKP